MADKADTEKLGPEILDEAIRDVTLDTYLDRHPATLRDEDYPELIAFLRGERVQAQVKKQKAKDKKAGIEETDDDDTPEAA